MKNWNFLYKLLLIRNDPGADVVLAKVNFQVALKSENASTLSKLK